MKILIPSADEKGTLNSVPSRVFGTGGSYVLYDTEKNEFMGIENTFYGAKHYNIAKDLTSFGVTDVIADMICKTCYKNLRKTGIVVWKDSTSVTIRESYQKFIIGGLFHMPEDITLRMHTEENTEAEDVIEEFLQEVNKQ